MSIKLTVDMSPGSDLSDARRILAAHDAFGALSEIRQDIFRPARKHGYQSAEILKCIEDFDEAHATGPAAQDFVEEFVGLLEKKFNEILADHGLMGLVE